MQCVGVDIAKRSFDVALLQANGNYRTIAKLANGPAGFQAFQDWLHAHVAANSGIVMEATGIYHQA
jgi:transposase